MNNEEIIRAPCRLAGSRTPYLIDALTRGIAKEETAREEKPVIEITEAA